MKPTSSITKAPTIIKTLWAASLLLALAGGFSSRAQAAKGAPGCDRGTNFNADSDAKGGTYSFNFPFPPDLLITAVDFKQGNTLIANKTIGTALATSGALFTCKVPIEDPASSPMLFTPSDSDLHGLDTALEQAGAKLQFSADGTQWYDYRAHLSVPFGGAYKTSTNPGYSGQKYYGGPISIMLRLASTGRKPVTDFHYLSGDTTLFYISPYQKLDMSGKSKNIKVILRNAVRFNVAHCRGKVSINPPVLDFGTLTEDNLLKPNTKAQVPFSITLRKDISCEAGTWRSDYIVPRITVTFASNGNPKFSNGYLDLKNGLQLSMRYLSGSTEQRVITFDKPDLFGLNNTYNYIGAYDMSKTEQYKAVLEHHPGDEIKEGEFSAIIPVIFNYN